MPKFRTPQLASSFWNGHHFGALNSHFLSKTTTLFVHFKGNVKNGIGVIEKLKTIDRKWGETVLLPIEERTEKSI